MNRKSQSLLANPLSLTLSVLLVMSIACLSAFGQASTSTIRGTVTDPQGNVVAGAAVTLSNPATGFSRTSKSNESGQFSFESIQPGTYHLELEAKGFKKAAVSDVRALVSKPTDVSVQLEIGAVTETVSVTAGANEAIINTQDASLGNNFVSQQIIQLPLNARNVANLLSLQPGVTPQGYVAGGRSDQANLTLDGVDVNEQQTGDAFTPVLRVSPDTVEEFRVTTTNPNAAQGRSSGAQVSLVTKSGSNQFHGNVFEYNRTTNFTANDFFNNKTIDPKTGKSLPRPVLIRNNYGATLSGPIVKDRFFFFYNYEARRDAKQTTINRLVPLASLGRGEIKFFVTTGALVTFTAAQINGLTTNGLPGGTAVVDVNPVALGILASAASKYPANNFDLGDGQNTGGFRFNAPLPVKLSAHVARFDYNVTKDARHVIFFRGNYQQDITANAPEFPDTPGPNTWSHPVGFVAGHTWTINSNKVNNFRYGLTREAFSNQGDSAANAITFRDTLSTSLFARQFNRTTPVQNITDDFTWIKGNHALSLGTNVRTIRNNRVNFAAAFDNGITNQSFYASGGAVLSTPVNAWIPVLTGLPAGTVVRSDFTRAQRTALAAVLGRLSQYTANFNFGTDGVPLTGGAPVARTFATEEYDWYFQDTWKYKSNVTLTYGLRYGLSRPVYETKGFEAKPDVGLQDYLNLRIAASKQGLNYDAPISVIKAGPANNAPGFYSLDKNNFQPRVAIAWSPNFKTGFKKRLFGSEQNSTFRGGFAITNDYFGQALAVNFDANNTLGFSSSANINANTYNITTNPGPLITGLGMAIRGLPGITVPGNLVFPQKQPQDNQRRIQGSLDSNLVSPINYSWNFTYGRKAPKGLYIEASYIGRLARHLLATRDVMAINNITDPKSGQDWYTAAGILESLRVANAPLASIPNVPWFDNMYAPGSLATAFAGFYGTPVFPGLTNSQVAYAYMTGTTAARTAAGCGALPFGCFGVGDDWTTFQDDVDNATGKRLFYQSQYGALSAYGTIGSSDYHGATLSIRQRTKSLTWDFNYTFSKSIDDASGLQTSGVYGSAFILNALRQRDNRAASDFDIRHIINFNSIWELPFGRGRRFLSSSNKAVNAVLGGWQFTSVFRYNSGLPEGNLVDVGGWPTNWNVRSSSVPTTAVQTSPTRGGLLPPNNFTNPTAVYNSFRSPRPGESGNRNILRYPGYVALDAGLYKTFTMPWNEKHTIQIRWETFNVTNTQHFTGNADITNGVDPQFGTPGPSFGNFTGIQGTPRVMQFAFRYQF